MKRVSWRKALARAAGAGGVGLAILTAATGCQTTKPTPTVAQRSTSSFGGVEEAEAGTGATAKPCRT